MIGKSDIGNLNSGSQANFIITNGDVFDKGTTIYENWVQGTKNSIQDMHIKDLSGTYMLHVNNQNYELTISGKGTDQKGVIKKDDNTITSKFSYKDHWVSITLNDGDIYTRMVGKIINAANVMQGNAFDSQENITYWSASKKVQKQDAKKSKLKKTTKESTSI